MKEEERKRLTWEDATQRFLEVAELGPKDRQSPLEAAVDAATWNVYNNIVGATVDIALCLNSLSSSTSPELSPLDCTA